MLRYTVYLTCKCSKQGYQNEFWVKTFVEENLFGFISFQIGMMDILVLHNVTTYAILWGPAKSNPLPYLIFNLF